jgi:undecaprenyl-diphosphatase
MTILQALVLGIVQGLSEFLPISSSAHLTLTPWLMGWRDPGLAFDVALHVGTLVAVVSYFRQEWVALLRSFFTLVRDRRVRTASERRVVFLIIATIPAVIAGLAVSELAATAFRSPRLIAVTLILMGLLLWLSDRLSPARRSLGDLRWQDALWIGVAQALALVPGVSRSGATITSARLLRLDRESAAVFSFLLSLPVIAGAAAMEAPDAVRSAENLTALAVGVAAAAISSWIAIALLLRFVISHSYAVFAAYRVVLGVLVLWILSRGG